MSEDETRLLRILRAALLDARSRSITQRAEDDQLAMLVDRMIVETVRLHPGAIVPPIPLEYRPRFDVHPTTGCRRTPHLGSRIEFPGSLGAARRAHRPI